MGSPNKDLHESNHLFRWGILIGLVTSFALIMLLIGLPFTFLHSPRVPEDHYLIIFLILLAFFFTGIICREYIYYLAKYLNRNYLKRFTEIKILGTYQEARPKLFNATGKIKHAVLLFHGFTTAPQQLIAITTKLEAIKLPYQVPNILGFGLDTTQLLEKIRCEDWFRTALDQFDVLKLFAEEVSVVGHSMGGLLATFIAQHRTVKHLILSAPAFYSVPRDLKYKKILFTPYFSKIYSWICPFLPKSVHAGRKTVSDILDTSVGAKTFHYLAVPVNCIKEFFRMQELVNLPQAQFESLTILYGKQDITIDNSQLLESLRKSKLKFQEYYFENSAHNIVEDYEREKIGEIVVKILRGQA